MSFRFKTAKRQGVHLITGLSGGTGSGKTWSALELATGMAGGKPFALIDTEAGRALQYADYFDFQHGDLAPPFSPDRYLEAILAAEAAGFPVAVIDSFSHEHAGDGGILDMHDAEVDRLVDNAKNRGNRNPNRDTYNMLAWAKVKAPHKRMVAKLLQLRIHLILCFRAEPKVKPMKVEEGKRQVTKIVDMGWMPIAAKGLDFEMAASFMLRNERPGEVTTGAIDQMAPTGHPLKLPEPLKGIFSGTYLLNRSHGEALAKWAAGTPDAAAKPKQKKGKPSDPVGSAGWDKLLEHYTEASKRAKLPAIEAIKGAPKGEVPGKEWTNAEARRVWAAVDVLAPTEKA